MQMDLETKALIMGCRKNAMKNIALDSKKWKTYASRRKKSAKSEIKFHKEVFAHENKRHAIY